MRICNIKFLQFLRIVTLYLPTVLAVLLDDVHHDVVRVRVDNHAPRTQLLVQPADHPLQLLVVTFAELVRGC
jgi:hypothetical protein